MDLKDKTLRILEALGAAQGIPAPRDREDPLDCLIGTILSQNTNDRNSHRAYESLRARFHTWEDVLCADPADIADAIRVGGLADQKSVRIRDLLAWVKEQYRELSLDFVCEMEVQKVLDLLCARKGIGRKTVSVMLAFACGKDVFPVDTHIHRIAKRLGLIPPNCSADKAHIVMADLVPPGKAYSFHINLIRFGRQTCHARGPECDRCPIRTYCTYWAELQESER